jgi:hypothetical protein
MIAWDYQTHAQEYVPSTDVWAPATDMPLEFDECYPDSVAVGRQVFAWFCGRVALWDAATETWSRIPGGVTQPTIEAHGRLYQLFRFASLVAAGEVVVLAAEGITVDDEGVPCYGCPNAPVASWVYRPPSDAA